MASEGEASPLVLDTHALYWYWTDPQRLGPAAERAFQELEAKQAVGIVPILVVAELHYLLRKAGDRRSVGSLLGLIDGAPSLRLEAVTRRHLLTFDELADIPEMHDRLIAAVAVIHNARLVSRDGVFRSHRLIHAIW